MTTPTEHRGKKKRPALRGRGSAFLQAAKTARGETESRHEWAPGSVRTRALLRFGHLHCMGCCGSRAKEDEVSNYNQTDSKQPSGKPVLEPRPTFSDLPSVPTTTVPTTTAEMTMLFPDAPTSPIRRDFSPPHFPSVPVNTADCEVPAFPAAPSTPVLVAST